MKLGQFTELFKAVLQSGDKELLHTPFLLIGSVGIGKTTSIRYAAEQAGYEVVSFVLSRHRPEHLEGVLVPPSEGNIADKLLPPIFEAINRNNGKVIVFFDEINTAPPSMINAALSFIQDRELAGIRIPDGVVMVAAGNPVGTGEAYVEPIKPVLTSRMVVVNVTADFEYLLAQGIARKIYAPEVISYISLYPDAYDDHTPYTIGDGTAKAYAVPRTWEYLSTYLKNGLIKISEEYVETIAGFVGEQHALRLLDFAVAEDVIEQAFNTGKFPSKLSDEMKMAVFTRCVLKLVSVIENSSSLAEKEKKMNNVVSLVEGMKEEHRYAAMLLLITLGGKLVSKVLSSLLRKNKPELVDYMAKVLYNSLNADIFSEEEGGES